MQAPVVQTIDSAVEGINHHPADTYYGKQCVIYWIEIYPMDSGQI